MHRPIRTHALATLAALALSAPLAAGAATTVPVVSGGATVDEFVQLNREAKDYSLKLVLAAKGSGAYLADVDVTVRPLASRETVVETRTEGPLMLAALAPGRYEVSATFADVKPGAPTTIRRVVTIPRSGHVQQVFHFDTGDEVGAESPPAFQTY
jgi:hypothetical protein